MENQDNIIIKRGRGRPRKPVVEKVKGKPGRKKIFTEEEQKEKLKRYKSCYMLNTEWFCDICNTGRDYTLAGKHCHLKTKKHQINLQNVNNR